MSRRSGSLRLVWIVGYAALARLAYLIWYRGDPFFSHLLHDAKRYHEWAAALVAGQASLGAPFSQAPGYPFLLALLYLPTGPVPWLVYGVQSLAGCLLVVVIFQLARRIGGTSQAVSAAGLAALYGVFTFHETKLLPVTLVTLLTAVAVERLQAAELAPSPARFLAAGAALGAATLFNPATLLLAVLAAGWLLLDGSVEFRTRLSRVSLVGLACALCIAPVTLYNLRAGGEFVLVSTHGGITLYQGNNPNARGIFAAPPGFSGSISTQEAESRRFAESETGRPMSDSEVSRFWFRKAVRHAASRPIGSARLLLRKLGFALDSYELPLEYNPQIDSNPARLLAPLPFAVILALALVRLWFGPPGERVETPVHLLLAAQLAVLLIFFVASRYRLVAMPGLLVLAGGGLTTLLARRRRGASGLLTPVVVGTLVMAWSFLGMRSLVPDVYRQAGSMGLCDRAGTMIAADRIDEGVALYREAIRLDPGYAFAHLDLGMALERQGATDEASGAIRRAAELAPGNSEIRFALGVSLLERGLLVAAAVEFEAALRIDPLHAGAANNLLVVWGRQGRAGPARGLVRRMDAQGLPVDPRVREWLSNSPPRR